MKGHSAYDARQPSHNVPLISVLLSYMPISHWWVLHHDFFGAAKLLQSESESRSAKWIEQIRDEQSHEDAWESSQKSLTRLNFRCKSENRSFASSIFAYSRLQFIVNKNPNLVGSHTISEITIVQYGMSMNFYNKLCSKWVIKVLDTRSQNWKYLMKKY